MVGTCALNARRVQRFQHAQPRLITTEHETFSATEARYAASFGAVRCTFLTAMAAIPWPSPYAFEKGTLFRGRPLDARQVSNL